MPYVRIDDVDLYFELSGTGDGVLLLLPQSTGPGGRDAFIAGLAGDHQVIAYDQRGTGRSGTSGGTRTMADQARDALAVLDAAGQQRAHLFCHSTGCGIGLAMVEQCARRVTSLVLVNPWTHADGHLTIMQRLRIAAARSLEPLQYAHFNAALLFPPEYRRRHAAGFARMAAGADSAPQNAAEIEARLEAILAFDARPLLEAVACPTLVVSAADDQLMPAWHAEEAAAAIPGAVYECLQAGGHMLPETRAEELLTLVRRHLRVAGN